MSARVVIDQHHDVWFSTDHAQKATLRTVSRTSEEQWFEEVRSEYLVPFDPERGPMIRFVLVRSRMSQNSSPFLSTASAMGYPSQNCSAIFLPAIQIGQK